MKSITKIVPIAGNSGHDIAEAQSRFAAEGWKIIKTFEERGRYYAIIERSK